MIKSAHASEIGTIIHAYAADRITHGFKLSRDEKKDVIFELLRAGIPGIVVDLLDTNYIFENLKNYVNDAIGFQMTPEVEIFYSEWCFGTADALKFYEKEKMLRIHDLKTGVFPVHMDQLITYAALYLLKNRMKAFDTAIELRIYQSGEIIQHIPDPEEVMSMMNLIVDNCTFLDKITGRRK
jgi:hypothetical protein